MSEMKKALFKGYGVVVKPTDEFAFSKIRETLTRIGMTKADEQELFQTCHILHKRGNYAIMHFKEMFLLNGKGYNDIKPDDIERRNKIVVLLKEWGLVEVPEEELEEIGDVDTKRLGMKILNHKEAGDWKLTPKIQIGKQRLEQMKKAH